MANNNEELPKIRLADSIGRAEEAQSISNETFIPIVEPVVGEEDKYFLKKYSAAFINDLNTLISEFNDFVVEMIGSEGMIYDIEDKVLENATNAEHIDVQSDLCAYPELLTNTIYNVEDNEYLEGVVLPTDLSNNITNTKYVSQLNFSSYAGTQIVADSSMEYIRWMGDDVEDNVFTPIPNRRYAIMFSSDGMFIRAIVQSVKIGLAAD